MNKITSTIVTIALAASGAIATSGRKWGTGGTEAVTGWVAFNPNLPSSGHGSARTYYGK